MFHPARWKKITVDQSKVVKNRLFRYFWVTRYYQDLIFLKDWPEKKGCNSNIVSISIHLFSIKMKLCTLKYSRLSLIVCFPGYVTWALLQKPTKAPQDILYSVPITCPISVIYRGVEVMGWNFSLMLHYNTQGISSAESQKGVNANNVPLKTRRALMS